MSPYLNISKLPGIVVFCFILFSCRKDDAVVNSINNSNNRNFFASLPTANAGTDQTIIMPDDSIILDGSKSTSPVDKITSYNWSKVSGPTACNIIDSKAVKTKVTNLVAGVYQFQLKVTDTIGRFTSDTVKITVLAGQPPIAEVICVSNRPEIDAQLVPIGALSRSKELVSVAAAGNKIVFAGGVESSSGMYESSSVDIYDPSNQSWSTAQLTTAREDAAVAVNGNSIFFAGGGYLYTTYFSTIDIYNASSNIWTSTDLSVPKTGVAGAAVGNEVMFAGGYKFDSDNSPDNIENRVEIYDLSTSKWSSANLNEGRAYISAVVVNQKIYFAGGQTYSSSSNKIDIYDDAAKSWSVSALSFLSSVKTSTAVGDKIFWTNGDCKVEIRNTNTGASTLDYLSRSGPGILQSVLKDNKVVFIRTWSKYFDIYDISTSKWSVGVLPQPILGGASVISVNNTIYVAGGTTDCTPTGDGGCVPVFTNQVWKLVF